MSGPRSERSPRRPARRPRRRRRLLLGITAVLVVAGATSLHLGRRPLERRLERWLEVRLAQALGGTVRIERLHVHPFPPELELVDVQLSLRSAGGRPAARGSLAGARVRFSTGTLTGLARRRLEVGSLVVERPSVELSDRRSALPRRTRDERRPWRVRIGRLELHDGTLRYGDLQLPLQLRASAIEVQGRDGADGRGIRGRFAFRADLDRPPFVEPLPLIAGGAFGWRGGRLEVSDAELRGPGFSLDGELGAAPGRGAEGARVWARFRAAGDLARLAPRLDRAFPDLAGQVSGELRLVAGPYPMRLTGEVRASGARLGTLEAERLQGRLELREGLVVLRQIEARAYGGRWAGRVEVALRRANHVTTSLTGEAVSVRALLDLARLPFPLAGRAEVSLDLEGEPGDPSGWSGRGTAQVRSSAARPAEVAVAGSGSFRLTEGHLVAEADDVEASGARFALALDTRLGRAGTRGTLRLDGRTADAERTRDAVLLLLASAIDEPPELLREPLHGVGKFEALLPVGHDGSTELHLDLRNGSFAGEPFDRADLQLTIGEDLLEVERLAAQAGTSRLEASLRMGTSPPAVRDLSLEARGWPLGRVWDRAGIVDAAGGRLSGHLRVRGEGERREGEGRLLLQDLRWAGESLDELAGGVTLVGERVTLPDLTAVGPAFDASGHASLALDGSALTVVLERGLLRPNALALVADRGVDVAAAVEVTGRLHLERGTPRGRFELGAEECRIAGRPLGGFSGEMALGAGRAALTLAGDRDDWRLLLSVLPERDWESEGTVTLRDVELELGADEEAPPLWARVSGEVALSGRLNDPAGVRASAEFGTAELHLGAQALSSDGPLVLRFEAGRLHAEDVHVRGDATSLRGSIEWQAESGELLGSIEGTAGLGLIAGRFPELRGSGPVAVELALAGTTDEPRLTGSARLTGGRLRLLGFPSTLAQTSFDLVLAGERVELRSFRGLFGGGPVHGRGSASLADGAYRIEIEGSDIHVAYPEGFRGSYGGTLALHGAGERATLEGELIMERGIYDEEFDLARLLGYGVREYEDAVAPSVPQGVELDVDFSATGDAWVRNRTAEIESRFDLHLGGDLSRPEVTGRLRMLEGGKLVVRDVEYRILSGALDFADLERINPHMDVRAATEVGAYRILLHVRGPLDHFEYELRSDPSLSQQDIIALLTTGRTLQDLSQTGNRRYIGDLPANYFAGMLTQTFERQLQRLLKLERVRIDPLLVREEADPTARVTIGKEVADNLFIVASTELGESEGRTYQIEWQASRKLRLTAERGSLGGLGGDVSYFDRFWFGRPPTERARAVPSPRAPPPAEGASRVTALVIEGLPEDERRSLTRRLPNPAGEPFSRSAMLETAEAIRRHYVRDGRIEVSVDGRALPAAGGSPAVAIHYTVRPGPKTELTIRGVDKREAKRLRALLEEHWVDAIFTENIFLEAADLVRQHFRERGFFTADVQVSQDSAGETRQVELSVDRGRPVRVSRVEIEGAAGVPESRIERQVLTRRGPLFGRRVLVPSVLDSDLAAIRALYRDEGFLRVEVHEPRVRLSAEGESAVVTLRIDEGPRFRVAGVRFPSGLPFGDRDLERWAAIEPGEVFRPARLVEAEGSLRAAIDALGYPDARVRGQAELHEDTAAITFRIEPGECQRVAEVRIVGSGRTKERIVRRELLLEPGDPISRERLVRTQHRLYGLGIFRSVRLEREPLPGGDPAARRLVVRVEDERPLALGLGAGYDSEAGPRGSFSLTHHNLGGWDRTLGLLARLSGIERRVQLTADEPRLFGTVRALFTTLWEKREEVAFTEDRRSLAVRLEGHLTPRWRSFTRYGFQQVDLSNVDNPLALLEEKLENVQLGDLGFTLVRDTRDDPFLTTDGDHATLEARLFAEPFLSQARFVKLSLQSAHTRTLDERHTLAGAIRVGLARPFGPTERVPLSERYFAGGDSTLRGFPRDGVGPHSAGTPIGGEAMLLVNQEWRFPIWSRLRGVLFYDAGNVFDGLGDVDLTDLRQVGGAGLRLETPIGPLRLEYGHKLDRRSGESGGEWFVAIGSPF